MDQVKRIENGWQCPECYGVNVECRYNRFQAKPEGFQCNDCGCNWSQKITIEKWK